MRVVIHDLEEEQFAHISMQDERYHADDKDLIISDCGTIHSCIGCFGCWIKTPGECVLRDGYEKMGEILSKADEVIIISRCMYGGYSPFVKNVIDRSISYLLPFFSTKKNETHHQKRYQHKFSVSVLFYGSSLSEKEKDIARKLVQANCKNFHVSQFDTIFCNYSE